MTDSDTTVLNRTQRPYALELGLMTPCGHYSTEELRESLDLARSRVLMAFRERDRESLDKNSAMARELGSELVRRIKAVLRQSPL